MKHLYAIHLNAGRLWNETVLNLLDLLLELIKRLLADLDAGNKPVWLLPKAIIIT